MTDPRLAEAQARHPGWALKFFGQGWLAVRRDEEYLYRQTGRGSVWRSPDLDSFLAGLDDFIARVET